MLQEDWSLAGFPYLFIYLFLFCFPQSIFYYFNKLNLISKGADPFKKKAIATL